MKWKRAAALVSAALMAAALTACGSGSSEATTEAGSWETIPGATTASTEASSEATTESTETTESAATIPDGMYLSELTGEPISLDIQNQRPITAMIDNDKRAWPHFGLNDCDVVYELLNSTENNDVTRLMAVMKDWGNLKQLGNIRSARPSNVNLTAEWNAILCHDGGPVYFQNEIAAHPVPDLSGYFARVSNGKATEFTEYITTGEIESRCASAGISTDYTANPGSHFNFTDYGTTVDLSERSDAIDCTTGVWLPFEHTHSAMLYDASTKKYYYNEGGAPANDGATGENVGFENVIVIECNYSIFDSNGYMEYNNVGASGMPGYYITEGKAIPITWSKPEYSSITRYYNADGNEITMNTGRTYICYVPNDLWGGIVQGTTLY